MHDKQTLASGALAAMLGMSAMSASAQLAASPATSQASDPNPYYIGVNQAFTHDSNVFRAPSGPSDNYSSSSLLGGFNQPIGRQRIFGNASVSANRYQDHSELNNTSYNLAAGLDWQTIENLSGGLNVGLRQNLAAPVSSGLAPAQRRNISQAESVGATARWGGVSLFTLEGSLDYSKTDYSAPEYASSETSRDSASLGLFYRPSGLLRLGVAARTNRARTPKALTLAGGGYRSNTVRGNNLDFLADYKLSDIVSANGRISYTKQTNSDINAADFSGLTGSLGIAYRPTGKLSFNLFASRDTNADNAPFSATTLAFMAGTTPVYATVAGLSQNNQVTNAIGLNVGYSATAKIDANAGVRYSRAKLVSTLVTPTSTSAGPDTTDVAKTAYIGASYAIARNWQLGCTATHERRAVSGTLDYSYTASTLGCSAQYTWR